jgi:hypothetical protein
MWTFEETQEAEDSFGGAILQVVAHQRMASLTENVFQQQQGLCRSDGSATALVNGN